MDGARPVGPYVPHDIHAKRREHGLDTAISALADRQERVVGREQLSELGVGRGALAYRVKLGRLHPQLPGAYSVGGRKLTKEGRLIAAVLSLGPGTVISHRTAADLWGIRPCASPLIEVTRPRRVRPRPGVRQHESALPDDEIETVLGIPVTSPGRTLLDTAAALSEPRTARALERTEVLRITHRVPLSALSLRHPRHPGAQMLAKLARQALNNPTRAELENRFQEFIHETGLPPPEINASLLLDGHWVEADCLWRTEQFVVELDGYETHGTRAAFIRDRRKDRRLRAAGFTVMRLTWWDLDTGDERDAVERELRRSLDRAAA
jgi:hypothetical protein